MRNKIIITKMHYNFFLKYNFHFFSVIFLEVDNKDNLLNFRITREKCTYLKYYISFKVLKTNKISYNNRTIKSTIEGALRGKYNLEHQDPVL